MSIRDDFPILRRTHNGEPLVYLDSGATTQKPAVVLDAVRTYYEQHNANVHRAAHVLAEEATAQLEQVRTDCQKFIGASRREEIVFTAGTTASINLVAAVLTSQVTAQDVILITQLEHHSNIVPWQMLAQRTGARLEAVKVTPTGELDMDDFHNKLAATPRVFACNHVSNALGTINPVAELVTAAKAAGAITVVDGAQAALHLPVDVATIGCDFYAFSGHKVFAPTGTGILYGRYDLLDELPPWQGGGEMIETVSIEQSTYQKPPYKFEAGTPNISGIIGLGAALRYLNSIDRAGLVSAEDALIQQAISGLKQIPGLNIVGEPEKRSAVVSFTIDGAHPHDIGTLMNQQSVAVRTGHHCTMPLMQELGIPGTVRASFSLYNNAQDVERLISAVHKATSFI